MRQGGACAIRHMRRASSYCPHVANASVSVMATVGVPGAWVYVFTFPVWLSVTVMVYSRLVAEAPKIQ